MSRCHVVAAALLAATPTLFALSPVSPRSAQPSDDDPCGGSWSRDDRERHCEVRDLQLAAGPLVVEASPNGSIRVEGSDRPDILVRAVVQAQARTIERARALASQVRIDAAGGRVSASGPDRDDDESWWVSYRIAVPTRNDLDLRAHNGSVSVAGVRGTLQLDTHNGSLRLTDVGGTVRARTHNGSLNVALGGSRWDGERLDVETQNGAVNLEIPDAYNAQLETGTVNGRFSSDFPITLQGNISLRNNITTTLGSGGPPIRARTTNGTVRLTRR